MLALVALSFVVNVYGIKILPALQMMGGLMHIAFFIAIVIPLLLLARRSTPDFVFTQLLKTEGGWQSSGVAWCLGMLTVTICFLGESALEVRDLDGRHLTVRTAGFDGAIHMCEEVHRPAQVIPRILVQSIAINGALAFAFLLVLLFCIGDVQAALQASNPLMHIFYNATGSIKAATAMQCALTIFGIVSYVAVAASASRLSWAFARDGGLPFSKYFARVGREYLLSLLFSDNMTGRLQISLPKAGYRARLLCGRDPLVHQPRVDDGADRHPRADHELSLRLVPPLPGRNYCPPVQRIPRSDTLRPVDSRPVRSGRQHLRVCLWRLYLYIGAVPDSPPCHGHKHGLGWAGFPCSVYFDRHRLAVEGAEEVFWSCKGAVAGKGAPPLTETWRRNVA